MYQGKYSAPKGSAKPRRNAATRRIEDVPMLAEEPLAGQDAPAVQNKPAPKQAAAVAHKAEKKEKKKRWPPTKGTIAFYAIYMLSIIAVFAGLSGVLSALEDWLVDYENSQPKYKCQEVFDRYFADPDWAELYDIAGYTATAYEGKEQYVAYMEDLLEGQTMRYVATASGDPNRMAKYIVKAGDIALGTFTLVTGEHTQYEITNWELGEIQLRDITKREQSVAVTVGAGQTVYINGQALGQEQVIRTTTTLAEQYLPEGLHGHSTTTYYLDGLLMEPAVEVKDAAGQPVATHYDPAARLYTAEFSKESFTITEEEKATVIAAAKVLSEFRIEAKSETALARYFDPKSDYYKATVKQDTWMQDYRRYGFSEPVVSEYYRYSETLFSAYVEMTLNVTRNNGSVKAYDASGTFFFTKRADGKWLVTDTNNMKLQQELTKVRLQYMLDAELLESVLVDTAAVQLAPPAVTVPEGKAFDGWFRETVDENGQPVLSLAFKPDPDTGLVYLGTGANLEPMVLHARFSQLDGAEGTE